MATRDVFSADELALEKLAYLRGMDAHTLDLSVLPAERRRFLAGLGRRLTAQNLARRDDDRKYPILLTLAAQSAVDVLDEVLLMFDQALSGREAAAREKLTGVLARARPRASGKKKVVAARFIRNDRLVDALNAQALSATIASPGARALYDELRARGIEHNDALRRLANRFVGILHGCLKTRTLYDEATAWGHRHNLPQSSVAA